MSMELAISVLALAVSIVSLIESLRISRYQAKAKIAEKRAELLCIVADIQLMWYEFSKTATEAKDVLANTPMWSRDRDELISQITDIITWLNDAYGKLETCELTTIEIEKKLGYARELRMRTKAMYDPWKAAQSGTPTSEHSSSKPM